MRSGAPFHVSHHDPVPGFDRPFEENDEAADEVIDDVLQAKAEADADGEGGQEQGHRRLAAPQHVLGIGGELGQEQGAVEPEPGDAEDGEEDGAVFPGEADVAPGFGGISESDVAFI